MCKSLLELTRWQDSDRFQTNPGAKAPDKIGPGFEYFMAVYAEPGELLQ